MRDLLRIAARQPARWMRKSPGATLRVATDAHALVALWWDEIPNWGDIVNPVLLTHLAGREPVQYGRIVNLRRRPVYAVVGSILDRIAVPGLEVWGAGFKRSDGRFWIRPRRIHAVRGPLTRAAILGQGLACPEVYGDPALLYPRFHRPPRTHEFRLGLVPHYADRDHPAVRRLAERDGVLVIDVLAGVREVPEQIARCDVIASSSLHGMILADAYGIPSVWIELSDAVEGDGFKFRDYLGGIGRTRREPLRVDESTSVQEILDWVRDDPIDVDLDRLLAACPFRSAEVERIAS